MKINLVSLKISHNPVSLCLNNKLLCLKKLVLSITGSQDQETPRVSLCAQAQVRFRSFSDTWKKRFHTGCEGTKWQ